MTTELNINIKTLKFCVDCKHMVSPKGKPASCTFAPVVDLVNGPQAADCKKMRESDNACGQNAVWFQPKTQAAPATASPIQNRRKIKRMIERTAVLSHIHILLFYLCGCEKGLYHYMLKWLAKPLQQPGYVNYDMVFCFGEHDAGRSLFFTDILKEIYGSNFALFPDWDRAQTNAAPHLLVANAAHEKLASFMAKRLFTSADKRLSNIILISNESPSFESRRNVIALHARRPDDAADFIEVLQWELENGGIQRFKDDLLKLDLDPAPF